MAPSGPRRRCAAVVAITALITGCTAGATSAPTSAPRVTTPARLAAAHTAPPIATTTTTTVAPTTTTIAPSTTAIALPKPEPAPVDERTAEPRVELGAIEIPAIDVTQPLYEGIRLSTLDRGPGHWPGTAMPGEVGNVVIAGHRTSKAKPFRHLDRLRAGDEVVLTTAQGRFTYLVQSTEVVAPDAMWIVDQTPDHTATLFACHPPGSTRERIVVHLTLADAPPSG